MQNTLIVEVSCNIISFDLVFCCRTFQNASVCVVKISFQNRLQTTNWILKVRWWVSGSDQLLYQPPHTVFIDNKTSVNLTVSM